MVESPILKVLKRAINRAYGFGLRHLILPAGDLLYGQRMMQRLAFLESAQWWSRDRIIDYRNQLLQTTIQHAYEVPFYREIMLSKGIAPNDIKTTEDLALLPVISKTILRAERPERMIRDTGQRLYNSCSSGSTGEPFCVKEDTYTAGWYRASFMLALQWAGWNIGEPHLQTGMTLTRHNGRRLKDLLLLCHYESAYDLTDQHLDHILDTLVKHNLKHLWGYPGSLYHIALRALETGRTYSLTSVVTWGDMVYPHYRDTIQQAFDVKVTDTYGCAEGIQIAAQCEGSSHYLVHSLDVVVEYLDDDNKPVPVGTPGNLVLTRLHAGPAPLIRYRIGDMAISGGDRVSECGRGFEIMESIQGRDTDIIVTPSGNRLIVHFFTGILEHYSEIESFQVVQHSIDEIMLRVIPKPEFSTEVADRMINQLKSRGADLNIVIESVDTIPLTKGGKRRFVICNLPPEERARVQ